MSKKVIAILLMSALVLSFACGCKNNDTESTSSTASKVDSSVSSSTESSKQNESKTESSKQSESSTDKDYEEMMSYVNKLSPELTYEQVFDILGEPDGQGGSGIVRFKWNFGKYAIIMNDLNNALGIYNSDTDEFTVIYSKDESDESVSSNDSKTESSKQSESSTDKDYEEMMSYVNKLSPELTEEQVYEILGEPDERYGSGINRDCYNFGKYTLRIIDFNAGAEIYNSETKETTTIY